MWSGAGYDSASIGVPCRIPWSMTSISVIGGGRWARTIGAVLCGVSNPFSTVIFHSRHNSKGVAAWIAEKGLEGRLSVTSQWPDLDAAPPSAAIIASGVADHVAAASAVLGAGIPVLVEKPVAITQSAVRHLVELASRNRTWLAASHVFLFARYFDAFVKHIKDMGRLESVTVEWIDGHADIRDDEVKSYDSRVTVFDDVLPHIVPLVAQLCDHPLQFLALDAGRGGAEVAIQACAGEPRVSMLMARNGQARRRLIAAKTAAGVCRLDFSQEPGVIVMPDGTRLNGDPQWEAQFKPLGAMLAAFLATVDGAALDERLSAGKALESADFADAARVQYATHQAKWLTENLTTAPEIEQVYALRELGLSREAPHRLGPQEVLTLLEAAAHF
jgi:predicted dehydrogenase